MGYRERMTTDRLESLMRFHPFTRLNKLLESVQAGGGNTPLALSVGEPQFAPPPMVQRLISEQAALWGKYPLATGQRAVPQGGRRLAHPPLPPARRAWSMPASTSMPVSGTREALFHIALSAVPETRAGRGQADRADAEPVLSRLCRRGGRGGRRSRISSTRPRRTASCPEIAAIPDGDPASARRSPTSARPPIRRARWRRLDYLKRVAEAGARKHNFVLASDECYSEIYRGTPPHGALEAARDLGGSRSTTSSSSIRSSKRSSGAGLRSGFVAGDARLIQRQAQLINFGGVATPLSDPRRRHRAVAGRGARAGLPRANTSRTSTPRRTRSGRSSARCARKAASSCGSMSATAKRPRRRCGSRRRSRCCPAATWRAPDASGFNPGQRYIRVALVLEPD